MTGKNKPIIIHDVDVSGCMFFKKNYKEDDKHFKNFCELNYISCREFNCAKCYFKQFSRREQECEELKRDNSTLFDKAVETRKENVELQEQLDQLKTEIEDLKNKNNILKEHSRYYKNESKRYKKEIGKLKAEKAKLETQIIDEVE